ncbi:hypothetical protein V8B97DRAFT_1914957 [Scleroderma yunnanense]
MFAFALRLTLFLAGLLSLLSLISAYPIVSRDDWAPTILSPDSNTIWVIGQTYTVIWDTSNQPSQITNPDGKIYLRQGDATQLNPIKEGFLLTDGQVQVTVPEVTPGSYQIVLYGNSGDWSPSFTINAPS